MKPFSRWDGGGSGGGGDGVVMQEDECEEKTGEGQK